MQLPQRVCRSRWKLLKEKTGTTRTFSCEGRVCLRLGKPSGVLQKVLIDGIWSHQSWKPGCQQLAGVQPAHFGGSGAGGVCGVQDVYVDGDADRGCRLIGQAPAESVEVSLFFSQKIAPSTPGRCTPPRVVHLRSIRTRLTRTTVRRKTDARGGIRTPLLAFILINVYSHWPAAPKCPGQSFARMIPSLGVVNTRHPGFSIKGAAVRVAGHHA
jgi:hypothetical protein